MVSLCIAWYLIEPRQRKAIGRTLAEHLKAFPIRWWRSPLAATTAPRGD